MPTTLIPQTPRAGGRELMDDPSADARALASEYRFLRTLNRMTAASTAVADAVGRELGLGPGAAVSVADLGAGTGDIGRGFLRIAARRGWNARWLATDRSDAALAAGAGGDACAGLEFRQADLLSAERALGARSHDVAHASLVLHHLGDDDVVRALNSMGMVARRLVVWNDLVRDGTGIVGAAASTLFSPSQLRHDAVLSVRRGFTLDEAEAFAEAAGLRVRSLRRWRHGPRFVLVADPAQGPVPTRRPVIRGHALEVSFGARRVLGGESIVVHGGEVCALTGANGAGKTTLLRTLVGAVRPRAGRAWCDRSRSPVGYLPQLGGLVSSASAAANAEFALRVVGMPHRDASRAAAAALAGFGIDSLASRRVDGLSVGQARRVALACAFAGEPSAILLDEPESGLDAEGRERLARSIGAAAHRGAGILVATHEPDALARTCAEADIPFRTHRVEVPCVR